MARKPNSRDRIVAAALELAREVGPGNLSLDAVARRAGVSKGGLLYNFPTKAALLEALVTHHIDMLEEGMVKRRSSPGAATRPLETYIDLYEEELVRHEQPGLGFLAALMENPLLLVPVRKFNRGMLDRMYEDASCRSDALVAFMALQGLRCGPLLDIDVLTETERAEVLEGLRELVRSRADKAGDQRD